MSKIPISIPAWEFAAETHILKFYACKTGFSAQLAIFQGAHRDMHMALQIPYVYDYITKICRKQAKIIKNHKTENVCNTEQGETPHRKYKRLKHGGGHVYCRGSVNYYNFSLY
jgi:hypothetical protein